MLRLRPYQGKAYDGVRREDLLMLIGEDDRINNIPGGRCTAVWEVDYVLRSAGRGLPA